MKVLRAVRAFNIGHECDFHIEKGQMILHLRSDLLAADGTSINVYLIDIALVPSRWRPSSLIQVGPFTAMPVDPENLIGHHNACEE